MYLCNFSINSSCGLGEASKKLGIRIFSLYVIPDGLKNYIYAFTKYNDLEYLRKYLKKDFILLKLIKNKEYKVIFIEGIKFGHGVMNAIFQNQAFPMFPINAENGFEYFNYITYNKNSIEFLLNKISKNNDIDNYECIPFRPRDIFEYILKNNNIIDFNLLTDIEKMILKKSLKMGYFNWPRGMNLDAVSRELNLSKPTVLYHIRNAERKIFEKIIN